jgi:hypothetical protein
VIEESERALRHKAELLSSLVNQEGFKLLEEELLKKERRMSETFWSILMSDQPPADMVEQMAFVKGFFRGMRYAVAVPKGAEKKRNGEVEFENEETEDRWSTWVAR